MALAFPKTGIALLAPLGAGALFWSLRGASWKRGLWLGWFAGLAFFTISFSWFGYTVGPYVGVFAPVLVLLPATFQACFMGLAGAATAWGVARTPRWAAPLLFACVFTLCEAIRSVGTFGAPFAQLGTSQVATPLAWIAPYLGTYGATFALCALAAYVADAIARRTWRNAAICCVALAASLTVAWVFWPARHAPPANFPVAAVQGNIAQSLKWTGTNVASATAHYEAMTATLASAHVRLVVWPETAVAETLNLDPTTISALDRLATKVHATLAVGAQRAGANGRIFNSLYIFDPGGLRAIYDKRQMVPIVETTPPYFAWLPFVEQLGGGAMSGGRVAGVYSAGDLRFAPLICWESAFSDVALPQVRAGAQILVIATDDAWFGDTSGPYMHAQIAQMRAIENGMWVVRAASTGVSGIIAPDGHWTYRAAVDVPAIVIGDVGKPARTLFSRTGPEPFVIFLALLYLALVVPRRARA